MSIKKTSFTALLERTYTKGSTCLGAQRLTMEHFMQEWVDRPEWEMVGWDLGGTLHLLSENEDDGHDTEPEHFGCLYTRGVRRCCLSSGSKMERRSPFLVLVSTKRRRKNITLLKQSHVNTKKILLGRQDGKKAQVGTSCAFFGMRVFFHFVVSLFVLCISEGRNEGGYHPLRSF